jgi:hypothetical protein
VARVIQSTPESRAIVAQLNVKLSKRTSHKASLAL